MTAPNNPDSPAPKGERIAKVLARAGVCSRRDAERLIASGRVSVNGTVLTSPAFNVTDKDKIVVDGKPMPSSEPTRMWRYYKPRGKVTTARDPEGRATVFDALPKEMPRVISIGRLDYNTEGLLLLTNDGELARQLELPATGWARRYRVRAYGRTDQAKLDTLQQGITVDGVKYGPIQAFLEHDKGTNVWITMTLREGKNREIRRVLEALGLEVNRLIRTSYGPFQLGDLEENSVREIPARVLADQLGDTDRQKNDTLDTEDTQKAGNKNRLSLKSKARSKTPAKPVKKIRGGYKGKKRDDSGAAADGPVHDGSKTKSKNRRPSAADKPFDKKKRSKIADNKSGDRSAAMRTGQKKNGPKNNTSSNNGKPHADRRR
jgi:23S rRNA pseudouridine2605 synthase